MGKINEYNITAQVLNKENNDKQTLLFNDCVLSATPEEAVKIFNKEYKDIYNILHIYSISKVNP